MAKFKLGDVVHLKSGGPDMTVTLVCTKESQSPIESYAYLAYQKKFGPSEAYYGTCWFEETKKSEDAFPEDALEFVK